MSVVFINVYPALSTVSGTYWKINKYLLTDSISKYLNIYSIKDVLKNSSRKKDTLFSNPTQ